MFKTKEPVDTSVTSAVKVLKLDFKPEKAQEELEAWLSSGWELRSTEAVLLMGQTAFLLAFLVPSQKVEFFRDMIG